LIQEDSLKKRYTIKLLANIISAGIGAILIAIVPKALGPIQYGQFVYLQDFFMKIISFLDMGSSTAFFTKLSARHTRKELITFYALYSSAVLMITLLFVLAISTFGFSGTFLPDIPNQYIYLGLFFGFFTWLTQIFLKISDAYALTVSVELIKIGHKLFSLLLLLVFVYKLAFDLKIYFYFNNIALLSFIFIISILFLKKRIFKKDVFTLNFGFKAIAKEFIYYCHPLVLYSIVGILTGLFDIWLLQTIAGSEQMGFYGLSYTIAAMCFLFTGAMTPIITREFSKSYEKKDIDQMRHLFYRYIPMLYSIAAYFAIFISFQSENVILIFTDDKFKEAYWVLFIMALYPIHQTYGQLSGSIFYATGQTHLYRNIGLITMGIGILLTLIFIYLFDLGAIGLAYKMVIFQLLHVNILLYFNSKFLGFDMKHFVLHQAYSLVFFTLLAFIASNIIITEEPLSTFFVSGFIYTLLVIIFAYLFPQIFATTKDEIKSVLTKVLNVTQK
jgi:O-antigen/teichoic acid export membrane protein